MEFRWWKKRLSPIDALDGCGLPYAASCVLFGDGPCWKRTPAEKARPTGERRLAAERDLSDKNWQGSDDEYTYLIRHAATAADCEPANVQYKYWLNVYRWHAISRTADPNTGESALSDEALAFAKRIAEELNEYTPPVSYFRCDSVLSGAIGEGCSRLSRGRGPSHPDRQQAGAP